MLDLNELTKLQGKSVKEVIDALHLKEMSAEDLQKLKIEAEEKLKELQQ